MTKTLLHRRSFIKSASIAIATGAAAMLGAPATAQGIDGMEMNRQLIALSEAPEARFWRLAFDELTTPEGIFRAVWELEAEVNNGGFNQYFFNGSGDIVPFVVDALRTIGAARTAEIAESAINAVGADMPWRDQFARRERVLALPIEIQDELGELDNAFWAYPDDLTALLHAYVQAHQTEIGGAGDIIPPG
jgi:hypothetical protein